MAGIDEKVAAAQDLLPLWFIPKMMRDRRVYGLMLNSGQVIAIELITEVRRVSDNTIWLDVELAAANDMWGENFDPSVFGAPSDQRNASINVSCVAAAFELAAKPFEMTSVERRQHSPRQAMP